MNSSQESLRWFDCPFVMRRERNDTVEYLSLKPQLELFYDNDQKEPVDIDCKLEKNFNLDDELGLTWHKSWIIPEVYVKVRDFESNEFDPGCLSCEISSVYPVKKNDTYYVQEVKLEGELIKQLPNYECRFGNLKFTTTSFNTDGSKFSLVLVLYLTQGGTRKILKSLISIPIYIDSRKEARAKKESLARIQDVFPPEKMHEAIVLKKNKDDEVLIENTLQGFLDYYTKNSKKSKIKHPFFVCYRFSSCFTLYYNNHDFKDTYNMHYHLLLAIYNEKNDCVRMFTPFVSNSLKKKVLTVFEGWQTPFTSICFSKEDLPAHYLPVEPDKLYETYKQHYRKFEKMSNVRKNMGAFEDDNEVIRCEIVVQKGGIGIHELMQQEGAQPYMKVEES